MATSVVAICNRALQKLGARAITALTDNSPNSNACNLCYEPIRDDLLREYTWNFSKARAQLAAEATAPTWGRANAFQLPIDFLRLIADYPEDNSLSKDWEIEGRFILTNDAAPLYLRYVKIVTDPAEMDPTFRELLSTKMAMEMCEAITQSNTKKEGIRQDLKEAVARAKRANAFEVRPIVPATDDWITARS